MSFNRLTFALIIVGVLLWIGGVEAKPALLVMSTYIGLALVILIHILIYPAASPVRRVIALLLDTSFLSWQLDVGGETVAGFFPLYLWITFGNGFRFGLPALWLATVLTTVGFAIVAFTTPFWNDRLNLSLGLCASLIVLPAYAGTLIRRLSKARMEAERANDAKTLFLANVSHELRTPLTAIIGMGRMLHESELDSEQREMTETVESAARSLLALIDDILQISRIDAGRLPLEQSEFNLLEFLTSVRQLVIAQATAKGLRIALHITPDTPQQLVGGERRLRELMTNLLSNAVKFTETGGVLLAVSVGTQTEGVANLIFEVVDTGIGIKPEAQSRIFDTFTQADATIVNRFGGTGLGLAISKRLALSLDGDLTVESSAGSGSTFQLAVPFQIRTNASTYTNPGTNPGVLVQLLSTEGALKKRLLSQLAEISAVVTEFDQQLTPQLFPATTGGPSNTGIVPSAKPVLVVCVDDMSWSEEQLAGQLRRLFSMFGPHVVLVCREKPTNLACLRWLCSSIVMMPAPMEQPILEQLRTAIHVASARTMHLAQQPVAVETRLLRILVAEDNKVNQRVLKTIIDKAGHEVVLVEDGEAALDMLETDASRFDIVLMDINMPRMDGIEATKLYRFMALGLPHLPIVALTADATDQMERRCLEAGMDACLTKPIQPARLLDVIQYLGQPGPASPKPSGAVTPIVDHPRFRPTAVTILDDQLLQSLTELGGDDFVSELMAQFMEEAAVVATKLEAAATRTEFDTVHNLIHALQSMAANMGARALVELCASWQGLSHIQLSEQVPGLAKRARTELAAIEKVFVARCAKPESRTPGLGN